MCYSAMLEADWRAFVNLKHSSVRAWLTPEAHGDDELQALLEYKERPFYERREAA